MGFQKFNNVHSILIYTFILNHKLQNISEQTLSQRPPAIDHLSAGQQNLEHSEQAQIEVLTLAYFIWMKM